MKSMLRAQRDRLFDRYRQVFDASGDPIVILDSQGRSVEMNAAARTLLRTEQPLAPGSDLVQYVEDMPSLIRRVRGQREGTTFRNVDVTLRIPGGSTVDCLITATQVGKDAEGRNLYQATSSTRPQATGEVPEEIEQGPGQAGRCANKGIDGGAG